MNDPVEQLIEEHRQIMRGVKMLELTSKMEEIPKIEVDWLVDFFRGYADDGHHAKEEAVLFKYLYEKDTDLKLETSPLSILTEQHVEGRGLVRRLAAMDNDFSNSALGYVDLLNRHIEMEDQIFPVLVDDYLSDMEKVMVANDFALADQKRDLNNLLKLLDKVEMNLI